MEKINNIRFPHHCKIYRVVGADPFSEDEGFSEVVYEGRCRKYTNSSLRTFKTKEVIKSDYALSLPGTVCGIKSGDMIDITDRQGQFNECVVSDAYAGNIGTTVFFNLPKN